MKYQIAIVDDNSIFCFIFEKLIKKYDKQEIEVISFSNGKEALDYFLLNKDVEGGLPHMVFVDINMPIMNGWELLDALNRYNCINDKTSYFIVSSSDNEIDINRSKEYACVRNFFHKPLDKTKLFTILNDYLH